MNKIRAVYELSSDERIRDRLLNYVKVFRLPPLKGIELVADVMEHFFHNGETGDVQNISAEQAIACLEEKAGEAGISIEVGHDVFYPSVPPYNRGSMPPACISAVRKR